MPVKPIQPYNKSKLNSLGLSLLENFGQVRKGRRRQRWGQNHITSTKQCDVVDEKACDDIISYLAPTLEPHKGCSIIDIHPGPCLFSQKLHNHLKPKWHLLMEPEERYLEPYIKPLLDQPGSRYCHTFLAGAHPRRYWESYQKIHEDPNLLPPRPALPKGDPQLKKFDPSLLVIGNLERLYEKVGARIELAQLMLLQTSYSVLSNELYHHSGLVRTMWWVPEKFKPYVFARNPMLRSAFSHGIEMGVLPTEVAGVKPLQIIQDDAFHARKRAPLYDRLSIDEVAQSMKNMDMSAPEGRELLGVDYEEGADHSDMAHKSPFEDLAKTPTAIRQKLAKARERLESIQKMKRHIAHNEHLAESLEYPQCMEMPAYSTRTGNCWLLRITLMSDVSLQIMHLEASYKALEDNPNDTDPATLDVLKSEILALDARFNERAASFSDQEPLALADINEEILAFYATPKLTSFDRRPYEPLKLKSADFFPPHNDMCLLDLMPKPRDLSVPDLADGEEGAKICREMLLQLYSKKNRPVIEALNTFAVNAGQDLVPMVPAIYDVRKGGRLNPRNVRAKAVTEEMVEGLVKAFFEWPFRPQTWELTGAGEAGEAGVEKQEDADGDVEGDNVE